MDVPLEHPDEEIKRLRRCINDLISILALPAMWTYAEPSQIVSTLLDTLMGMLRLDLVYVRLKDPLGDAPREMVRIAKSQELKTSPQRIGAVLDHLLGDDPEKWPPLIRNSIDDRDISIVPMSLGLHGEVGLFVTGSERADYPGQTERLLLSVAGNQASIALREARLLSEQKRVASELDQRVSQRTAQLAATNEELKKEIIERKLTEERLRHNEEALCEAHAQVAQSEERWRSVFENSAVGVALTDLNGRFIATNPVYEKMLGYTAKELQELSFLDITLEEYREPNCALIGELLAGELRQFQVQKQYRRKNGTLMWVRNNVSLVRGTERVPQFLMALSEDITEHKEAEEELRRSETFLAEGQRLSRTGSFSWRLDPDEMAFSDELSRIFEFEPGVPVTFEQIGNRVHPEDIALLNEKIERARRGSRDLEYEIRLLMPDNTVKYLHTMAHTTRDRNGRLEILGAVQDITQRRLSEEALVKARSELSNMTRVTSLGMLTASIAHEVSQPLSGIITNAGTCMRMLAADPPNVDGARETARRTIRDGNRASEVITRLRALFTRKEATTEPMDLNEAAREVIALSLSELQQNRVILRAELADDLSLVAGDRVQLQQVIMNLLRNASDAMRGVDDRPRELVIRTEPEEEDRVRLIVQDAGTGFDPQSMDRLFEAFYTTKDDGMGMGLSVSRSIIENHGGRLWAMPNDGPGATFSFSIPCRSKQLTGAKSLAAS